MAHTREVVTLQIGHYANFVGTHWWNIQESAFVYSPAEVTEPKEINHDIMFREGKNLMGDVTFTPRLIAFDLKGSLNTLKQEGVLYDLEEQEDDLKWNSDVTLHKSDSYQKNEFLRDLDNQEAITKDEDMDTETDKDATVVSIPSETKVFGPKVYDLDQSVKVWSDFLRPHLHPRSIHILNQYQHEEADTFDVFGYGQQILNNHTDAEEIEDRLHFFLEECDHLQGIHILADTYNGFGGLTNSLLEGLHDDYGTKAVMLFSVSPPVFSGSTSRQDCHRLLNTALSYSSLPQHSSYVLPLSCTTSLWGKSKEPLVWPNLKYQAILPYHSSAILAASLDTATLPYRLEHNASHMVHLTQALTPAERKFGSMYSALPFPTLNSEILPQMLINLKEKLMWKSLSLTDKVDIMPEAQSVVLRGVEGRLGPHGSIGSALLNATSEERLTYAFKEVYPNTLSASCILKQPCKVTSPFPHIFSPNIGVNGHLSEKKRPQDSGVETVPVMTAMQCSKACGTMLSSLHQNVSKLNIKKFHKYIEAGLEEDEFKESLFTLQNQAQAYEESADMS